MKFASKKNLNLKSNKKDGELCLVSPDLKTAISVASIAPNLREALENWEQYLPAFQQAEEKLKSQSSSGFKFDQNEFHSCLPRTWLFADGSAFINHIKLVRKARNAALPETLETVPLMYQAESGEFLDPNSNIPQIDFSHGTDFEAEVGVILDYVPMGTSPTEALKHIKLITIINDVSLRGLIPAELAQGFGFFQSKPNKILAPIAVTPDELGSAWKNGRLHLPLNINFNGEVFGRPQAGEMHFHFGDLISHAAKTRSLAAGTLIGSGTVSNENSKVGCGCIVEKRTIEQIESGAPKTPFMKVGDQVHIWMETPAGQNIFGDIKGSCFQYPGPNAKS